MSPLKFFIVTGEQKDERRGSVEIDLEWIDDGMFCWREKEDELKRRMLQCS